MEKSTIDELIDLLEDLQGDDPKKLKQDKGSIRMDSKWDFANEDIPEENWPED